MAHAGSSGGNVTFRMNDKEEGSRSGGAEQKNWKGIIIALLVIGIIIALVVVTIIFVMPDISEEEPGIPLTLADVISPKDSKTRYVSLSWLDRNEYAQHNKSREGLRLYTFKYSQNDTTYSDDDEKVTKVAFVEEGKILLHQSVFEHNPKASWKVSPDKKYIFMTVGRPTKKWRHSTLAQYIVYETTGKTDPTKYPIRINTGASDNSEALQYVAWAPVGHKLAIVYKNDIYIKENPIGNAIERLTTTGKEGVIYNGIADWLYEEEIFLASKAMWWSSDGQALAYSEMNDEKIGEVSWPLYSDEDSLENLYGAEETIRYPKAGDVRSSSDTVPGIKLYIHLFGSANKNPRSKAQLMPPSEFVKSGLGYYLLSVRWLSTESLVVSWIHRLFNVTLHQIYDIPKGVPDGAKINATQTLSVEAPPGAWLEVSDIPFPALSINDQKSLKLQQALIKQYSRIFFVLAPRRTSNGWFNHIALINGSNSLNYPTLTTKFLTSGTWEVKSIRYFDPLRRVLWFEAYRDGDNDVSEPTKTFLYSIDLSNDPSDDKSMASPTCRSCLDIYSKNPSLGGVPCESVTSSFSQFTDGLYVLTCRGPTPPSTIMKSLVLDEFDYILLTNQKLRDFIASRSFPTVEYRKISLPESSLTASVRLTLPKRLKTDEIFRYPVFVKVYNGPGSFITSRIFSLNYEHYLASAHNVIIASLDGRGTGNRGYDYRKVVYKNLGNWEVRDQLALLDYLQSLPYILKDNTVIFGWSYGGYVSGRTIMNEQNKFKCVISVAPVTSWKYYDTAYAERFMARRLDNEVGYNQSAIYSVSKSQMEKALNTSHYAIFHGLADDNVHFQHTAILMNQLIKVGAKFLMGTYPNQNHKLGGVYKTLYKTITQFLLTQCFPPKSPLNKEGAYVA